MLVLSCFCKQLSALESSVLWRPVLQLLTSIRKNFCFRDCGDISRSITAMPVIKSSLLSRIMLFFLSILGIVGFFATQPNLYYLCTTITFRFDIKLWIKHNIDSNTTQILPGILNRICFKFIVLFFTLTKK